jgi:purine-binding chemotaxis protein CheW
MKKKKKKHPPVSRVSKKKRAARVPEPASQDSMRKEEMFNVVGFQISAYYFGIDIKMVSEVLRMVEITRMPKSPAFVEGVINIRGRIVPIINLRKLFGLEQKPHTMNTEIIIGKIAEKEIGFTIDQIAEIVTVTVDDILPPDKQTVPMARYLIGMVTLTQGLMFLIDLTKILDTEKRALLRKLSPTQKQYEKAEQIVTEEDRILRTRALELSKRKEEKATKARQIITFNLGDENYGMDITKVREIAPIRDLYHIPSAPKHIMGAINLRGDIIAIMDLKQLFNLSPSTITNDTRIIVLGQSFIQIGFVVDSVPDIIELPVDLIEPPLTTIERVQMDYLEGEAQWESKLIGLINVRNIIDAIQT